MTLSANPKAADQGHSCKSQTKLQGGKKRKGNTQVTVTANNLM